MRPLQLEGAEGGGVAPTPQESATRRQLTRVDEGDRSESDRGPQASGGKDGRKIVTGSEAASSVR